jgi:hypothetical protein
MTVETAPVTGTPPEWLVDCAANSAAVYGFCVRHGILAHVETAVKLVKQHISSLETLDVRVERDPEVDGQSIVVDVTVRDEVGSFLRAYDRCKEAWVAAIPGPALSAICLVYSVH